MMMFEEMGQDRPTHVEHSCVVSIRSTGGHTTIALVNGHEITVLESQNDVLGRLDQLVTALKKK